MVIREPRRIADCRMSLPTEELLELHLSLGAFGLLETARICRRPHYLGVLGEDPGRVLSLFRWKVPGVLHEKSFQQPWTLP